MSKIIGIISVVIGVIVFFAILSMIPAMLWYTFDDELAYVTGINKLGSIPFLNMWGFTLFLSFLFGAKTPSTQNKE